MPTIEAALSAWAGAPTNDELRKALADRDERFWAGLQARSDAAEAFEDLLFLVNLRKRAEAVGHIPAGAKRQTIRLALIGGCSLYPLQEFIQHQLVMRGFQCEIFTGKYDNYVAEIMDESSDLYRFRPDLVLLIPAERLGRYPGRITDARVDVESEARGVADQILGLCSTLHQRSRAEVLLANFCLPHAHDPGPYRTRVASSDWTYRKMINLELGLSAPAFVRIVDIEFLAYRRGGASVRDAKSWFESKQLFAPDFMVDVAGETAGVVNSLRKGPKKVLVLDLDNTLWGGVIGDDGVDGIEIGDTSPRGEAFKAFQKFVLSLTERGVLLAVCSKNTHQTAIEPFEKHPEMVLRAQNFVAFKANWNPKSENIREIARELNLGLDSFVFVDDNPAEIEIVRQFVPEVTTLLVGPDPADYVHQLQDARLFEPNAITAEDAARTDQYRREAERKALQSSATDLPAYLASLEMQAEIREFNTTDAPRIAQLINKSNQWNLTTRRRTEAEVLDVMKNPASIGFSVRLKDRLGDHGLISVVIANQMEPDLLVIDTWLMSCRVLSRQVEDMVCNEIARLALARGATRLRGIYLPTAKNSLVADLYTRMGFELRADSENRKEYELDLNGWTPRETKISVRRQAYEQ